MLILLHEILNILHYTLWRFSYRKQNILHTSYLKIWVVIFTLNMEFFIFNTWKSCHWFSYDTYNEYGIGMISVLQMKICALCFFKIYWILCISHTYIKTMIYCHERWNFLYFLYESLVTSIPWDFLYFIWKPEWRFSCKEYGTLLISYEPLVLGYWLMCCLFVSLCLSHMCAHACACVTCLWVCVHVSGPLTTQKWRQKTWDVDQPKKEGMKHHIVGKTCKCISVVPLSRIGMRKGWWKLWTVGPQIAITLRDKKSSQTMLCCVCLYL